MKLKAFLVALPLAIMGNAAAAETVDIEQINTILQNNACFACHQVDQKVVGPAYQEVAEKYQDDPDYRDTLAQHIKEGSQGIWGPVPMPPNAGISDDDLNTVVDWIMAGAPH